MVSSLLGVGRDPAQAGRFLDGGFDDVVEEDFPSNEGRDNRLVTAGVEDVDVCCVVLLPPALPDGDAVDPRGTGLARPPGLTRPGLTRPGLTPRIFAPVVLIGAGLEAVKDVDVVQGLDVLLALARTGVSICEGEEVLLADADDEEVDEAEIEMTGGFLSLTSDDTELLVEEVETVDDVDPLALVLVMTFDRSAELVADSKYLSPSVF